MDLNKKIKLFTADEDAGEPTIQFAIRSAAVNHLSVTVCDDYTLTQNCRVDTAGNLTPFTIETGNTVYNNFSGSVKFNGGNFWYAIKFSIADMSDTAYICQINTLGRITAISTTCTI